MFIPHLMENFWPRKGSLQLEKPKMSSQNQRFHCLAENERFAILSLKFLVWSQNSFAFCPKSAVKIPDFSGRQTLVFTSTREKFKTWVLTRSSLDKSSSGQKSFFLRWVLNSEWNTFQFFSLFHGHGKAAGDPVPKGFMAGTEIIPRDFHVWWQLGLSPRCPCPLHGKSQLQMREEQCWTGSLGLCAGCSPRALITTLQTLISGASWGGTPPLTARDFHPTGEWDFPCCHSWSNP